MNEQTDTGQESRLERLVGRLNHRQVRALELMRADRKRDLYQACTWTEHCITYTAGEKYEYLTKADVADLEARGLIERKWKDRLDLGCWILTPNALLEGCAPCR